MATNHPLLSSDLPFHPIIIPEEIIKSIEEKLSRDGDPLSAIAYGIRKVLNLHVDINLDPNLNTLDNKYQTSQHDLKMYKLGYLYIIDSILATTISLDKKDKIIFLQSLFVQTTDPLVTGLHAHIRKEITATTNLYKQDKSGIYLIRYLEDYPFSHQHYFLAGVEVAIKLLSYFTQVIAISHPNLNLLTTVGIDVTE